MLSMLFILLIVLGLAIPGLAAGVLILRHSPKYGNHSKAPRACECCHNSTEVERPVV